ncbi:MAG: hypothetical protein WAK03_03480 [Methylocystis sp.]|jgi:hypothetical protein
MSHGTLEKAEALSAVYQYVASRLESVDQRCSVLMVLSGSFVSYLLTTQGGMALNNADLMIYLLHRAPLAIGVCAFVAFYMSQSVRIKNNGDIISAIVFSNESLELVTQRFCSATGDEIFAEIISNQRLIGNILIKKGKFYHAGAFLFGLSAVVFALQR